MARLGTKEENNIELNKSIKIIAVAYQPDINNDLLFTIFLK